MHPRPHPAVLFLLLPLFLARMDASALTWAKEKISTEVIEGQQTAVKEAFPLKNSGSHPVTIIGVETSCGCTTATLDKKTYAVGESGEIDVVFDPAERTGLQEKIVTITTD